MIKFTVPRTHLRAIAHLMASKDIRHYLNAVLIEADATGEGRMVATDGHVMGQFRILPAKDAEPIEPFSVIVPDSVIKGVKPDKHRYWVTLEGSGGIWMLDDTRFSPIDAEFPDYVRVTPGSAPQSGVYTHANIELLARFGNVAKTAGAKAEAVRFGHNRMPGNNPGEYVDGSILVEIQDLPEFSGVCMPLRTKLADTPTASPQWARTRLNCKPAETPTEPVSSECTASSAV